MRSGIFGLCLLLLFLQSQLLLSQELGTSISDTQSDTIETQPQQLSSPLMPSVSELRALIDELELLSMNSDQAVKSYMQSLETTVQSLQSYTEDLEFGLTIMNEQFNNLREENKILRNDFRVYKTRSVVITATVAVGTLIVGGTIGFILGR